MFITDLFEAKNVPVVVTYPGRFQPFHQGHAGVFAELQKLFGKNNVYILTSNDQSGPKSPFNFADKQQLMAAAGVPADHIVQTTAMYALPEGFDPHNTIFVTAVGAPDADRLNPDSVLKRDKKDKEGNVIKPAGSAGYYKTWGGAEQAVTADQHGYVVVIPEIHKEVTIKGKTYDVSHGTECRNLWNIIRGDAKARSEFLSQLYGRPETKLGEIFDKIPASNGLTEGKTVTRIDSKQISDFGSNLKTYKHTDDWTQSGIDNGDDSYWTKRGINPKSTKGLYAGDPHRTALYATGNANETRYVEYEENGQPVVYFDKKDLPAIRSRKTYLTVFDAGNFKHLPTGEYFSDNPGKPIEQKPIGDPFKYIASQGWQIRITDNLEKVFKQIQAKHKAGKIGHYGAEGMNEGVAEGEVVAFPKSANVGQQKTVARKQGNITPLRKATKPEPRVKITKNAQGQTVAQGNTIYDVYEDAAGVGVVATNKKMARDPRYSTSMTVDVHPDTPKKQLKAFRLAEMKPSDFEIRNFEKLDTILTELCKQVIEHQKQDPDYWGMVAACVVDPDDNVVPGVNYLDDSGQRVHAERAAIDSYREHFGEIPEGSIIVTTLSPCCHPLEERYGESCTELINDTDVHKVYCGYKDPTQEQTMNRTFHVMQTRNESIVELCKSFADTFLGKLDEAQESKHSIDEDEMMTMVKEFLPVAMKELKIKTLPHIVLQPHVEEHDGQATFGRFVDAEERIYLGIADRHPVDILRTLAHELVHFKQYEDGKMYHGAGETGSPIENEAHVVAGIIMRHFNKKYPAAIKSKPLEL